MDAAKNSIRTFLLKSSGSGAATSAVASEHDAGIAQVLVAVDQVDLSDLDVPAVRGSYQAMPAPARQKARAVHAKLADQEIRTDHADCALIGGERLDIRDHPDGAGFRRLRPGVARAQPVNPVLHAPTVVEGNGDLAAGISARPAFPAPSRCIRANTSPAIRRSEAGRAGALPFPPACGIDRARTDRATAKSSRCQSVKLATSSR